MYDAAVRMASDFGCAAIGIQYQQGLKDTCVASDLAEGLLNNPDRPPVAGLGRDAVLFDGLAVPHFNEVDECAGVDALLTNRVWTDLGIDPSTTLHDVRWGAPVDRERRRRVRLGLRDLGRGAGLALHRRLCRRPRRAAAADVLPEGRLDAEGRDASRARSCSRRVYVEDRRASTWTSAAAAWCKLSDAETERRWQATTPQWPIMHAVLYGDHARPDDGQAQGQSHPGGVCAGRRDRATARSCARRAMARALGIQVNLCGDPEHTLDRHQAAEYRA